MIFLPRRRFLALSGAVLIGVTGCRVSDPTIIGGPTTPPIESTPTPSPEVPGRRTAWVHERELALLAERVNEASERLRLSAGQAAVTQWMAEGHRVHAIALLDPRPARRPTSAPAPGPVPPTGPHPLPSPTVSFDAQTREAAVGQLRERLARALTDHRRNALGSQGPTALQWGSLAAYARAAGTALVRDAPRPEPPVAEARELEPWTDAEAMQQALRQVHGLIYGYQVAIPWLDQPASQLASDLVVRRRELRDDFTRNLREQGRTAPAAEPAYGLPVVPRDHDSAAELLWRMEAAFAPFAGAWLAAAAETTVRRQALETLGQTATVCIDWGGPLVVWPGWPG